MKKVIDYLVLVIWSYLMLVVPAYLLIYVIHFFEPDFASINSLIIQIPDLTTILLISIIFPCLGLFLLNLCRGTKPILIWRIEISQIIFITVFSIIVGYIAWNYFAFFGELKYFGLLIDILFFIIYLPQVILFIDAIDLSDFSIFFKTNAIFAGILATAIILSAQQFIMVSNRSIIVYKEKRMFDSLLPVIKKNEPHLIYRSTNIILYGNNFGIESGNISDDTKINDVQNQYGKINFTFWDNNKIIFQVPLHWQYGDINVWINKDITWKGKKIRVKSNIVKFKLLDATQSWNKNDDAYFEQLKHLNKETLKINGYNTN